MNLKHHRKNPYLYLLLNKFKTSFCNIEGQSLLLLRKIYRACTLIIYEELKQKSASKQTNVNNSYQRLLKNSNNTRQNIGRLTMFMANING